MLEAETLKEAGSVSSSASSITLIPGDYQVMFGNLTWPIKVEAGQKTVLNPGVVSVRGASASGHMIRTSEGQEVGFVSNVSSSFPLPPGEYTIEIGGKLVPFSLKEGEIKKISVQKK